MKKLISGAATAALALTAFSTPVALLVTATPAMANSPSEQWCTDHDGVFSRDGGQVSCTISTSTNVGNSDNSQTIDVSSTDGSNGTLNNDPKHSSSSKCDGTGNTSSPQDHC